MRLERSLERSGTESERALVCDLNVFGRDWRKEREQERLWGNRPVNPTYASPS